MTRDSGLGTRDSGEELRGSESLPTLDSRIRIGDLALSDRGRVAAILRATDAFRADEVDVALELFDEVYGAGRRARGAGCGNGPAAESSSREAVTRPAPRVPHPDYLFLGAFTPDDELAGYACYGPTPGTDRTWDLYWIAVDPVMHGAGVGTVLLTEVERRLQRQQARMLVIETSSRSDYAATRIFYGRRGYTERARVREFYAPGDDRIIYTKRFHSPAGGERSRHE